MDPMQPEPIVAEVQAPEKNPHHDDPPATNAPEKPADDVVEPAVVENAADVPGAPVPVAEAPLAPVGVQATKPAEEVPAAPEEPSTAPSEPQESEKAAADATDAAIVARLRNVLKDVDLSVTTEKMLRCQLEAEFKAELSSKKALIRAEVEAYLRSQDEGEEEAAAEEKEEEEGGTSLRKRSRSGASRYGSILSEAMSAFLGMERCDRFMVVKKLWEYIKANELQDPRNKKRIILDDKLKTIFPGKSVDMFKMQKHLSKHVFTADKSESDEEYDEESEGGEEEGGRGDEEREERRPKKKAKAPAKPAKKSAAPQGADGEKKKVTGFTKPVKLDEEMAAWMGKESASRPEITKYMWRYVKERGLQDPSNGQIIVSDDALLKLTGEKSFKGFSFAKHIKHRILGYVD